MQSEPGYVLAPMGRRSAAWFLDAGLGALLAVGFVRVAGGGRDLSTVWHLMAFKSVNGQAGQQLSAAMHPSSAGLSVLKPIAGLIAILAVISLVTVAYRVVTTAMWGAGLGKAVLGLKIVVDSPGEPDGETPGWGRSWKRWAVPLGPGLIPLPATGLLAFLPAFRDQRRRGLHDRAAGTVVINVRAPVPQPDPPRQRLAPQDASFYVSATAGASASEDS